MACPLTGLVAGLDEAGRAPLAGPVVSSCVVWEGLPPVREKVNDSKLLTEKERNYFFGWILDNAYKVAVGLATPEEIERLNIHHASLLSMERAVQHTGLDLDLLVVDGLFPLKSVTRFETGSQRRPQMLFRRVRVDRGKGRKRPAHDGLRQGIPAILVAEKQGVSYGRAQEGHRDVWGFSASQKNLQGRQGVLA